MKVQTSTEAANKRSWAITRLAAEQATKLNQLANDSVASAAHASKDTLPPTVGLIKHNVPGFEGIHVYTGPPKAFEALSSPHRTNVIEGLADENPSILTEGGTLKDLMPVLKSFLDDAVETSYDAIEALRDPDRRGEKRTAVKTTQAVLEVMNFLFKKLQPFLPDVIASHSQTIGFGLKVGDEICLAVLKMPVTLTTRKGS